MGTIISSGVGSGLDIGGLVTKLVDAERVPKALRLDQAEAKVQAKLSALGTLQSALASFRDTVSALKSLDRFQGRQSTLSSSEFLSATAGTDAVPGVYSIEVEQLASAHKLQSADFASSSTVVGTGTLHFVAGGGQLFDVDIDSESNTLAGIAAAINGSAAGAKVVATVVSGAGVARLTISARDTGVSNGLTITQSGGDNGLASLVFPPSGSGLTELAPALDARALIDGVLATSTTNSLSGAIAGVELTLAAANAPGETTELTVGFNSTASRKTIDDFVESYNGVVDALKSVTSYDVESRRSAPLFGDGGVRNIVDQLRRILSSSVPGLSGDLSTLSELGITAALDGKLSVDSVDLDAAFSANFDAIGELFAHEDSGIAVKLDALLKQYLDSDGIFDSRTAALKSSIDTINDRREALAVRLTALQERYTKQFNALDGLLAQLQGTSNFLSQQLSQLPGVASTRKG
jgi:flagellar hook-associated protein 2